MLLAKMARNLIRSSNGFRSSPASYRTRWLNSRELSSRLMYGNAEPASPLGGAGLAAVLRMIAVTCLSVRLEVLMPDDWGSVSAHSQQSARDRNRRGSLTSWGDVLPGSRERSSTGGSSLSPRPDSDARPFVDPCRRASSSGWLGP